MSYFLNYFNMLFTIFANFTVHRSHISNVEHVEQQKTIIKFKNVNSEYFNDDIDKRVDLDINSILEEIKKNIFVKLSLLKSSNKEFNISISDSNNNIIQLTNETLEPLEEFSFNIKNNNNGNEEFKIYYIFYNSDTIKNEVFYCANGRTVKPVEKNILFSTLPDNKSSLMLINSTVLDQYVNNERNAFNIPDKNKQLDCDVTWDKIIFGLQIAIDEILSTVFPNIQENNEQCISELINENPHLSKYIKNDKSKIKDKRKLLSSARKQYENDKYNIIDKFKNKLENNRLETENFINSTKEINEIAALELAEYFVYRQQIIAALQKMYTSDEKIEEVIHNLFMKKGTQSCRNTHQIYDNNLWLFDDKFMTYLYAASDTAIKKIQDALEKISEDDDNSNYRPDLAVFFSNDDENIKKDAIVVEFKAFGASNSEKSKSFAEIIRNARAIRESIQNIERVWCYTITKFDDKFRKIIDDQDFNPLFTNSTQGEIYYRFYWRANAHCYYISADALLTDAFLRNKVFLDIIKNN